MEEEVNIHLFLQVDLEDSAEIQMVNFVSGMTLPFVDNPSITENSDHQVNTKKIMGFVWDLKL